MRFIKDPDAILDYTFDWSIWLEDGESITSQTIDADNGITVDSVAASSDKITVWLSGGTKGKAYIVSCEITTDNTPARTDERSIIIEIKDR